MVRLSDAGVLSHPGVASRRSSATSSRQWQSFPSISPKVLVPPGAFAMAQHPDRGRITTLLPAKAPASTERPPSSWCPTCLAVAGCSQGSMNEGGRTAQSRLIKCSLPLRHSMVLLVCLKRLNPLASQDLGHVIAALVLLL